jgi:hypothetical protein
MALVEGDFIHFPILTAIRHGQSTDTFFASPAGGNDNPSLEPRNNFASE